MADKTILIVGEGRPNDYDEDIKGYFGNNDRVIAKAIDPNDGGKLRGYAADLIVLTTDVSDEVRNTILMPMVSITDAEIIELY